MNEDKKYVIKRRPKIVVLVGLPASGKSTWRANNPMPGAFVYSTDDIVEREAAKLGKTYSEVWSEAVGDATKEANAGLAEAIANRMDIVADRTNLTVKTRARIISQLPGNYYRHAVVFPLPTIDNSYEYLRRLNGRPGKTIPWDRIDEMTLSFVMPDVDEGFDKITVLDIYGRPVA